MDDTFSDTSPPAGRGPRLVAAITDMAVVKATVVVLTVLHGLAITSPHLGEPVPLPTFLAYLLLVAVPATFTGRTLGKHLNGLQVVAPNRWRIAVKYTVLAAAACVPLGAMFVAVLTLAAALEPAKAPVDRALRVRVIASRVADRDAGGDPAGPGPSVADADPV